MYFDLFRQTAHESYALKRFSGWCLESDFVTVCPSLQATKPKIFSAKRGGAPKMDGLPTNRYEALFVVIYVVFDQLLNSP